MRADIKASLKALILLEFSFFLRVFVGLCVSKYFKHGDAVFFTF